MKVAVVWNIEDQVHFVIPPFFLVKKLVRMELLKVKFIGSLDEFHKKYRLVGEKEFKFGSLVEPK